VLSFFIHIVHFVVTVIISALVHCCLGDRKGIRPAELLAQKFPIFFGRPMGDPAKLAMISRNGPCKQQLKLVAVVVVAAMMVVVVVVLVHLCCYSGTLPFLNFS